MATFKTAVRSVLLVLALISLVNLGIVLATGLPEIWIQLAKNGTYEWEAIIVIWLLSTAWRRRQENKMALLADDTDMDEKEAKCASAPVGTKTGRK
jgi:membrane protease YdiL (CAAX protease family)